MTQRTRELLLALVETFGRKLVRGLDFVESRYQTFLLF